MSARIVVLVSGAGSNLLALLRATHDRDYGVTVVAVGADREGTNGIVRARDEGVADFTVPFADFADRAEWNRALAGRIAEYQPDFVVSAGFMRLLGPEVLRHNTVVNTHPALLPAFPGAHAVRDALAYGVKVTGATVHFVDEGVDTGPVIAQAAVPVLPGDDEKVLLGRIQEVERGLLVDTVGRLAREGWRLEGRTVTWGSAAERRPGAESG